VLVAWYSAAYPTRRACREELTLALLAAERAEEGPERVLIVNPEPELGHVLEVRLLDRRFAGRDDISNVKSLAELIADRARQVSGPFGAIPGMQPTRWYGGGLVEGLGPFRGPAEPAVGDPRPAPTHHRLGRPGRGRAGSGVGVGAGRGWASRCWPPSTPICSQAAIREGWCGCPRRATTPSAGLWLPGRVLGVVGPAPGRSPCRQVRPWADWCRRVGRQGRQAAPYRPPWRCCRPVWRRGCWSPRRSRPGWSLRCPCRLAARLRCWCRMLAA
jgi:hypothetical protein